MIFDPEDVTYLAAPYTSPDPEITEARRAAANHAATIMIKQGATLFSPLSYEDPLLKLGLNMTPEKWYEFDLRILRKCDSLTILTIPGWDESHGVKLEIKEANRMGIPVRYVSLEDLNIGLVVRYARGKDTKGESEKTQ